MADSPEMKRVKMDRSDPDWSTIFFTKVAPLIEISPTEVHKLVTDTFIEAQILRDGDTAKLERLISEIQSGYIDTPYHNFIHATHVFLGAHVLLRQSALEWNRVERAALLFTAIIHDLEHQGVPNVQLVKEGSPLADKYENKSIAENNSYDRALALLHKDEFNIFAHFSEEEMSRFHDLCKSIILATDIADGDRIRALYARIEENITSCAAAALVCNDSSTATAAEDIPGSSVPILTSEGEHIADVPQPKLDVTVEENRSMILCLFMKLADVGAPLQHLDTSRAWAQRFYDECRNADKQGRGPTVDHTSFHVGQGKFYDSYLRHVIEVAESTGALPPQLTGAMHGNLDALKVFWGAQGPELLVEWSQKWQ